MRIFHPLRRVPVALLWGGLSLSALGDQLYAVAPTWIAIGVLGSNAGYLGALQAFIALLAVLGIGKRADRWDHKRGMIGADLTRAAVLLAVAAAWLASGGPNVAQVVCAIVVRAIGQAVFQPAPQSALPSMVDNARLLPAFAAAAALAGIGGPMKDIQIAVLRQLHLSSTNMAAAVRAQMAMSSAGTLLAMLITPTALALAGIVPVVVACGAIYVAIGAIGFARHAGWVEAQEQAA